MPLIEWKKKVFMFKTLKNFRSVTKHNSVFQKITGQHCCSQQRGKQMKVTNTTLFTKIEVEPLQYLCIYTSTWPSKQRRITTPAHPGEQHQPKS